MATGTTTSVEDVRCGWWGSVRSFLVQREAGWLASLEGHHRRCMGMPPDGGQVTAWRGSFAVLRSALRRVVEGRPAAGDWTLIFEYELPRERGRRPDVVVLADGDVLVLEFKEADAPLQSHLDQVDAYARDLAHYHAASQGRVVAPVLVLTRSDEPAMRRDGVTVVEPAGLAGVIAAAGSGEAAPIDAAAWLAADYAPQPSLVSAARTLFRHEPLPAIRRAQSAGIPGTLAALAAAATEAQARGRRHLALVTGVPGAGKTLAGLQFVYENHFDAGGTGRTAVFLSGNGPLVKVLQHALKSSVFVQDVHGFLKQYGGHSRRLPEEYVWVYDEAQRAWDAERVRGKRQHDLSEPEDFLRLGGRVPGWAMIVGLIGEGQEIHLGEEAGLGQWDEAIAATGGEWVVHCPRRLVGVFGAAARVEADDRLDLTTSLRSHLAKDVQAWVRQLLDGRLAEASRTAVGVAEQGFDLYVTRDLEAAKAYARERYAGQEEKRYGLLASSKGSNLDRHGMRRDWSFTQALRVGPWYNDPPDSPRSCCQLRDVATEFSCQGLELDFPIVGWGSDLTWGGDRWLSPPQPRSTARDPHRLRVNSYRVLLTRGRDGFVVFVPRETAMEATFGALRVAGLRELR